ncbi:MAG: hypothetical protein ACI4KA_02160 [Oscillospiraceae bacterium]
MKFKSKTLTLNGTEINVKVAGNYTAIRNDSSDTVYLSAEPGIVPDNDGVISIPVGGSLTVNDDAESVYVLGTGKIFLLGTDSKANPFKSSAQQGGSGVDDAARAAISAHTGDTQAHVSSDDRAAWNGLSNPNLLINPDFAINQRANSTYSGNYVYGVDHWQCQNDGVMTATGDGIKVGFMQTASSSAKSIIRQHVENSPFLGGKTCTLSVYIKDLSSVGAQLLVMVNKSDGSMVYPASKRITAAGVTTLTFSVPEDITDCYIWLYGADMRVSGETTDSYTVFGWSKLEIGQSATPYLPPDPAAELAKCQRYYQICSSGNINAVDLRPSMRATPAVTQLADGNYAYNAEL